MRAAERATGGGVAVASGGEGTGQFRLDVREREPLRGHQFPFPGQGQPGLGEGPFATGVDFCGESGERTRPGVGHQGTGLGQPCLQRVEPGRIVGAVGQQAHAFTQGLLIGLDVGGVDRFGGEHQPIEEPAAVGGSLQKEAILGRGQPDLTCVFRQAARGYGLALDPHSAARRTCGLDTGAEPGLFVGGAHGDGHRPGATRSLAGHPTPDLSQTGAAQSPAGNEEADGLQQVGLARAVGPR